ncbi:hypothetical protein BV22DRAFT_457089 [Leucogyrophana mollusca]|uniref:Uncharacterized protein n=1 Tax=Leucogyrophana mollusca TaxID=85980 RepID=A0ACB8BH24_9AGAM|nr:hypothetical protein BV22DRAFT_457089 [Leucogyrophana mollusca]
MIICAPPYIPVFLYVHPPLPKRTSPPLKSIRVTCICAPRHHRVQMARSASSSNSLPTRCVCALENASQRDTSLELHTKRASTGGPVGAAVGALDGVYQGHKSRVPVVKHTGPGPKWREKLAVVVGMAPASTCETNAKRDAARNVIRIAETADGVGCLQVFRKSMPGLQVIRRRMKGCCDNWLFLDRTDHGADTC